MESLVIVSNALGLHARPAAAFVKEAARYQAQIQVYNVTTGKGPASARSILAILALGVRQGHSVRLVADGAQAAEALEALGKLLEETPDGSAAPERGPVEGGAA